MSYILDALKKAEHDRIIGQVPGIGSEHEPVARSGPGRWIWLFMSVLLVNAVLLAVLLWPDMSSTPSVHAVAPSADRFAQGPQPMPQPVTALPSPAAVATVPPQQVIEPPDTPPLAAAPTARPLRPLVPLPEPESSDTVETLSAEAAGSGGHVMTTSRPPVAAANNNLPVWPQISSQLLSELNGSLHLDVHVYSHDPAERFVMINMRKYRTGEKLQEGPLVDDITPDSVILSLHGQRFRMQSQ